MKNLEVSEEWKAPLGYGYCCMCSFAQTFAYENTKKIKISLRKDPVPSVKAFGDRAMVSRC